MYVLGGQSAIKPIVNAYACNPYRGSEEGVGWNWVRMISRFSDPWVIVASYHREDIEGFLRDNPKMMRNVTFIYIPHKPWHYRPTPGWKRIEGSVFKPIMNMAYALWLRDAYRLARELHGEQGFDLAHQLTYVGFRFPGRLWKLDIPFVWGPIGGLENTPWRFLGVLGWRGAIYYAGRNLINSMQKLTLRSARKAFAQAALIVAATSGIQKEIRRWYGRDSQVITEVGPPEKVATTINCRQLDEPLRLVWSGEHLPGKALPLLLRALASLSGEVVWHLDILGDGPSRSAWNNQAEDLGIAARCHWHGLLPRDEALAVMGGGHLFVITSLKDLTSTVLLEALALGVPVLCPDHCGFSDVVDDSCGIKLPMETPARLVHGFAKEIYELACHEPRRQALARGALARVRNFSWANKQQELEGLYEQALGTVKDG